MSCNSEDSEVVLLDDSCCDNDSLFNASSESLTAPDVLFALVGENGLFNALFLVALERVGVPTGVVMSLGSSTNFILRAVKSFCERKDCEAVKGHAKLADEFIVLRTGLLVDELYLEAGDPNGLAFDVVLRRSAAFFSPGKTLHRW